MQVSDEGALHRTRVGLLVIALAAACGDDALSPGDTESTGTGEATTVSASGSTAPGTMTADPSDVTTDATETSDPTGTSDATEGSTGTDGSSGDATDGSTTDASSTGDSSTGDATTGDASSDDSSSADSTGGDDSSSGSDSTGLELCGNGVVESGETCDGDDLGGADCETLGNDGGTLGCADDCTFETSACFLEESLQNDNGNCGFTQVGCSDDLGTSGNPQDLLECYVSNLAPPIDVVEVEYFLGTSVPLPDALDLVVHAWDGPGNPPGALLGSVALDPMIDIVAGGHVFPVPAVLQSATAGFCVGLHGEDPLDGFRVEFTDADGPGESWLTAPQCGLTDPIELTNALTPGNYCIRPTVHGH